MFDNLTNRLSQVVRSISNRGRLTEDNIKHTLREVRVALMEADVSLSVVRDFTECVKKCAIGQDVNKSLTPGQELIKIVRNELISAMGKENNALNLATQPPAVVILVGLQGAGKTTTVSKLGYFLHKKSKKKVLMTSVDIYRPAAVKQLELLANQSEVDFYYSEKHHKPVDIIRAAQEKARLNFYDVLLVDTAGRLHTDELMMEEIEQIQSVINPIETILVADAMTGQDAVRTAKDFSNALALTGVILTKADSDARGGAALSIRHATSQPIKFIGVGEKYDALEPFHPSRIASRILGMGDMLSLIEDIESKVDYSKSQNLAKKLGTGDRFDFNDFLEQLKQIRKIGGISNLIKKLPGHINTQMDDLILFRAEAMINSMTHKERKQPEIIKGSRKRRIAFGSGLALSDVNRLLKKFTEMQRMMKKVSKGGISKILRSMKGITTSGLKLR
jgi:signal recognition particle subunit SRP54